jgi:hypothetical protein
MKRQDCIYDMETAKNVCLIGLLDRNTKKSAVIEFGKDGMTEEQKVFVDNHMNSGRLVFGYNNSNFDSPLLGAAMNGAGADKIFEVGQAIINSPRDVPSWKVSQSFGYSRSPFNEVDLMHYVIRTSLKKLEARSGMDRVVNLPFDPEKELTGDLLETTVEYLYHDLDATLRIADRVEDQIQMRLALQERFELDGLLKKTAARVAETVIMAKYCSVTGLEVSEIKAVTKRYQNCAFTFKPLPWLVEVVKGTAAESLLQDVMKVRFIVKEGKRAVPDKDGAPLPKSISIGEDMDATFGIGGLHSIDDSGSVVTSGGVDIDSFDVSSYYPHLILSGIAPNHLSKEEFCSVYGEILKLRMDAKKSGDKPTADGLKLVANSTFGLTGDKWSALYSPQAQVSITLSGQIALIALLGNQ